MDGMTDLELARKRYKRCMDAESDNRELMRDDLKFVSGGAEQWPVEVRQDREKNKKPMLTVNRTKQFVHRITGDVRQNSPAIKLHPVEDSDQDLTEIFEGIIRHIEQSSGAKAAYQTALDFAAKAGYGCWVIETEYQDDSFLQDIKFKRKKNPLMVYFDPDAEEVTKSDGKFAFELDWKDREEAKKKWGKEISDFENLSGEMKGWQTQDKVLIARYWEKVPTPKHLAQLHDGTVVDLLENPVDPLLIATERKFTGTKVQVSVISGDKVLEGPKDWAGKYIPLVPVYGEEINIDGETEYRGIVRDLKDPQRMLNYWRTTSTETIALQPKVPWILTPEQVAGHESMWKAANTSNLAYLTYNPDPEAPAPTRQPPPQPSVAMLQEAQVAEDDMKGVTGIYDAALGQRSNETSGIAIQSRQQESNTANFLYLDNLSLAIEHTGRILVDLIPKIYDTERVVRVLGEDGEEKLQKINTIAPTGQKINDITVGKYDVRVSMGPSYKTRRMEAAQTTLDMVNAIPGVAAVAGDIVVRNMDTPGAEEISERLKRSYPPGIIEVEEGSPEWEQQQQAMAKESEMQQIMLQLQLMREQAEIATKQAEAAQKEANALKATVEAQAKQNEVDELALSQLINKVVAEQLLSYGTGPIDQGNS